jgi:hypothetical protein
VLLAAAAASSSAEWTGGTNHAARQAAQRTTRPVAPMRSISIVYSLEQVGQTISMAYEATMRGEQAAASAVLVNGR